MIKNFLKATFRNLWKNRIYSFLNIAGLAIGITCAGLIFLWVEAEVNFDTVNTKKNRLYSVKVNLSFSGNTYTMGSTPRPLAISLKNEIPGIVNAARSSDEDQKALFSFEKKSLYANGRFVDSSVFSMFTLIFAEGSAATAFQQLYSLVITEKTAMKFFGTDRNIIGRTVRVDNFQDYKVTGVVKDLPENSTLQFEWLAPYQITIVENQARWGGESDEFNWGSYGPFTYVELDAKANPASVNKLLRGLINRKKIDETNEAFLFPMANWRLYDEFANGQQTGGGRIKQVHMLSAIAWIILLIACINFMNLATANSQRRTKEVGVRKVLGAGRKRLITQFLGEALLMAVMAATISLLLMVFALPAFNSLMQKHLSLELGNPVHFISLFMITAICGLVAGSYPAIYLSSFNPAFVLKGLKHKTGSAALIRKGLVVFQFAVSVVFIISTIIIYQQLQHVKNRKLGFNKDNLIEIDMQHDVSKDFLLIKSDLLHTGFIENAAIADHTMITGGNTDDRFKWQGKSHENEVSIAFRNVSPEFLATSGMQIAAGRDFVSTGESKSSNVIINQSMERMMGEGSAVGKIIQSPRGNAEGIYSNLDIIGVVNDYVYGNMYGRPGPVIFFCKAAENANLIYVRIKPQSDAGKAVSQIEAVMKKDNAAYPLQYKFVDDQFNEMFFNEMLISKVSGVFAILAIFISCLGLFGLATYTAERRTKEIGIRKVLGASVTGLVGLLSKDFMKLVVIACLIAFPVAGWMMYNWLQGYDYRIAISPSIFIGAGAISLLIASLTISFQAIRAALVNPVVSLRNE